MNPPAGRRAGRRLDARNGMNPDRQHRLGGILMWGGVVLALVVALAMPQAPPWPGLALFLGALAAAGAFLKRSRTCPRKA